MIYAFIFILVALAAESYPEIRIENAGDVALEEVKVDFPSQTEEYGTIPPRGVTSYRAIKKAYRYARIEAIVEGKPALIQPIDFVGEKELKPGKYTYVLTVKKKAMSEFDRLELKCRRE